MTRARDLGIGAQWGPSGTYNAITDVPGVRVGHKTLIRGDSLRTGITVVVPRPGTAMWQDPAFAASHTLNGNGEFTGLEWIREGGLLETPIAITNTHSVGIVRDALVAHQTAQRGPDEEYWALPVVAETWDGRLNDVNGQHVTAQDLFDAIDAAAGGPVEEGNVGGGTGMIAHGFKAGIGTASRVVDDGEGAYTVGVLVQANHGTRDRFSVDGIPIGPETADIPLPGVPGTAPGPGRLPDGSGSIIGVVATDAPLLPTQCRRLAQRAGLGVGRLGGAGEHWSGDIFLAFATGNSGLAGAYGASDVAEIAIRMLPNRRISQLFAAVVDATEEAILNAILAARTMVGRDGFVAPALPADRLRSILTAAGR
ncbi:P1 family peptidase [Streptomyces sp. 130]|uniref:DmpA family aminopeptidase n=1 Tax=Streptomyces sp. 130 TaxID=2591006 RepID=UPI00117BFF2A|nr:P1 family peptidase [Streptomyces sp. 130]TRV76824.1 P1 family peptidase [Streptomyces sp. 130]